MEKQPANWIAFYTRNGKEVSFLFYFAGRPTLSNVVSKMRKEPQLVQFVLPYARPGMTAEAKANAFLFVNGIEDLAYTPYVASMGSPRS